MPPVTGLIYHDMANFETETPVSGVALGTGVPRSPDVKQRGLQCKSHLELSLSVMKM